MSWPRIIGLLFVFSVAAGNQVGPLHADDLLWQVQSQRVAAVAKAMPSTVCVFVPGGAGGGSGVLISPDGFALTNFHVSSPAGTYMRCGLSDGNVYDAVVVGIDPVGDLAMIQLLGRDDFPVAEFVSSRSVRVGDWCFAIGNPFLLATNLQPTVTAGIISGTARYQEPSGTLLEYGSCFQTDASINPGNSGGPLYNDEGDLLGIIGRASFEKRGRVNVGVGYAISGDQAQNFLGCLRSGRIIDHATLGATLTTDDDGSVRVANILQSSDAFRRGIRYDDELLEINGFVIRSANEAQNLLATYPASWRIPMTFRDEDGRKQTLVRLASVHRESELIEKMKAALPPPPPKPPAPKTVPPDDEPSEDGSSKTEDSKTEDSAPEEDAAEGSRPEAEAPANDLPVMRDAAGKPIPKLARERIVARRGFGNYFYNQRQQEQFIERLRSDYRGLSESARPQTPPEWLLAGQAVNPQQNTRQLFEIRIGLEFAMLKLGDQTETIRNDSQWSAAVDSQGSSGLLTAMHAWYRMLYLGPTQFGETYYWGTAPLGGQWPLRDCTYGIHAGVESRFFQHPDQGRLEAIETFADRDLDPAELWIDPPVATSIDPPNQTSPANEAGPIETPQRLELRYGLETMMSLEVQSWQKVDANKTSPPAKTAEETGS